MSAIIPVGTVIPYAGSTESTLPEGWLPCDGREVDKGIYNDLFNIIGTTYGGKGITRFNLPDLRGMFVRATDHGKNRDLEAEDRKAGRYGGCSGDHPGSVQDYATALPRTGSFKTDKTDINNNGIHNHPADHLPDGYRNAAAAITGNHGASWDGSGISDSGPAGSHTHNVTSGDKESRPVNIYMHWIIKCTREAVSPGESDIEPGFVSTYAGNAMESASELALLGWMPCVGTVLSKTSYQTLYENIGNIYVDNNTYDDTGDSFNIPDLRGLFIRGVSDSSAVGSKQGYSTARPVEHHLTLSITGGHSHNAPKLPHAKYKENACHGHEVANYPDHNTTNFGGAHEHTINGGGDLETRPVNMYLDYIIKVQEL